VPLFDSVAEWSGVKKRVDEMVETLHNLASSLMNTTLRQPAVPNDL